MKVDIGSLSRTELIETARTIPWYHTIDFGDFVSEGEFNDFSPLLAAYGFPKDMVGMNVIDVGRASGFLPLSSNGVERWSRPRNCYAPMRVKTM